MKVFSFVKKVFFLGLTVLSSSITSALKCVSLNNQECKVRPKIVNVSSNNPIFYHFSVKINRCGGNCNSINDSYAKICVPDVVKNLNVKVFNLMSRTNESRSIKFHETCKCICRLNKLRASSSYKQKWNKDKCRCECKKLVDKGACNKGYIFDPSNCKCECDNLNIDNTSQYLDYLDCQCKKKIIDLIVEKCTEYDNKTKIVNKTDNKTDNKIIVTKTVKNSCKAYIILTLKSIVISTVYTIYFVYYNWFLIKIKDICTKYNARRET